MRDFLQDLPSFEAKYRGNVRGDCPLAMGHFIMSLSFPNETGKFTGRRVIFSRRGDMTPALTWRHGCLDDKHKKANK